MTPLRRPHGAKAVPPHSPLRMETLEDRLAPALVLQLDYSLDQSGFFNNAEARAALERAAAEVSAQVTSTPAAIAPSGGNTWQAVLTHPTTGAQVNVPNLTVPAGVMVVYVGGKDIGSSEAGVGGPGGYTASGSAGFRQAVANRGQSGFAAWGGSVTFDVGQPWYFGADSTIPGGRIDFQSVATHELTHVLGFGTSRQWDNLVQGGRFIGSAASASFGTQPPVSPDGSHWAQGIDSHNEPVSMQPAAEANRRVGVSDLDRAALQDIGWQVSTGVTAPTLPVSPITPTVPNVPADPIETIEVPGNGPGSVLAAGLAGKLTVVSGPNDGTVQIFALGTNGQLTATGGTFQPFGNFRGAVRAATADLTGDGVEDVVVATGPNGGSRIRILDGTTMRDAVTPFSAFEGSFSGGVFLASGDFNRDGKAELVITPDQGGGSRVRVYTVNGGGAAVVADFFGINDPSFRGGTRPAVGDVDGDGAADLIVAAGFGGGPRVSIIDGDSVLTGRPTNLVGDFFAFEQTLRNGVYVTVGDVDGDGKADLTFGAGPGGGPRVLTLSGARVMATGGAAAVAAPLANYFAGDTAQRGGVRVTVKDGDGDGRVDVVTGSGQGSDVRVYRNGTTLTSVVSPFTTSDLDGVYVG